MLDHLEFIARLAQSTGEILLKHYRDQDNHPRLKKDFTVLTNADLAADAHIKAEIQAAYPDDHILSEEGDTSYPADSPATWVIDPLDGTGNFSLGLHYWGTSIARFQDGVPVLAGLCFPVFGEVFTAAGGQGAFLNGKRLDLINDPAQVPIAIYTCDSRLHRQYDVSMRIKPRILGSVAYNFCAVASGVSRLGIETSPHLWDIAASWLILREAGGHFRHWADDAFPLLPGNDYARNIYPSSAAATLDLLDEADQKIKEKE